MDSTQAKKDDFIKFQAARVRAFNKIMAKWGLPTRASQSQGEISVKGEYSDILACGEKGVEIAFADLDNQNITYATSSRSTPERAYVKTRLYEPDKGPKYKAPGNFSKTVVQRKTYPFLPPKLIEAYTNADTIETLIVTEGEAKALKCDYEGLFCIGIPGFHIFTDKTADKEPLMPEIIEVVQHCNVMNVIYLQDGDCRQVIYEPGKNLTSRPLSFYNAIKKWKDRCFALPPCQLFYMHLKEQMEEFKQEDTPKGIDDLFVKAQDPEKVKHHLLSDERDLVNSYFYRFNLRTKGKLQDIKGHFLLRESDLSDFYVKYVQDFAPYEAFIFHGSVFQCNDETDEVEMLRSSHAMPFLSVGPDYFIEQPVQCDRSGLITNQRLPWAPNLLTRDYVKTKKCISIFEEMRKYASWFFKPDNFSYQPERMTPGAIYKEINRYQDTGWRIERKGDEKDHAAKCSTILTYLKHIFCHEDDKYEEALDWLTLLWCKPMHTLHVVCLVSEENETGKSRFGLLVKEIFKANAVIITSQDLESNFNSHYADKLAIIVDEAQLTDTAKERIKFLSTAQKIPVNAKGVKQAESDFYGKIILITNKELDFLPIQQTDNRFFVNKVPGIKDSPYKIELDPGEDILDRMRPEIESFLQFLSVRKMKHEKAKGRFHIPFADIKTQALARVIEHNRTDLDIDFEEVFENLFNYYGCDRLYVEKNMILDMCNANRTRKYESREILQHIRSRFNNKKGENNSSYQLVEWSDAILPQDRKKVEHTCIRHKSSSRPYKFKIEEFEFYDADDGIHRSTEAIDPRSKQGDGKTVNLASQVEDFQKRNIDRDKEDQEGHQSQAPF